MRKQRNVFQMCSGKELNKMKTSILLDAEFKTLVTRMLNELRKRVMRTSTKRWKT